MKRYIAVVEVSDEGDTYVNLAPLLPRRGLVARTLLGTSSGVLVDIDASGAVVGIELTKGSIRPGGMETIGEVGPHEELVGALRLIAELAGNATHRALNPVSAIEPIYKAAHAALAKAEGKGGK